MSEKPSFQNQDEGRGTELKDYWPLAALILIAVLAAFAINASTGGNELMWMHYFMGFFLCQFAMLKLFHPDAFADGFEMYDLIAGRFRLYGYVYPLIELGLGLAYLAFFAPIWTYAATVLIMTISSIGVISALMRGLDINCPCMGSILDVPLSTVTLAEDLGMGGLALIMLILTIKLGGM